MGAGKSTLGIALAERLQRPFLDSDSHIESSQGRSGKDIADSAGVPALHALETDFLVGSLAVGEGAVIAAAASVADDPHRLAALTAAGHVLVFMEVAPDRLEELAGSGDHRRPLPATEAAELYHQRRAAAAAARALMVGARDDVARSIERIVTKLDQRG